MRRYIAIMALVLLAGCSHFSKKGPQYACPKAGFVVDADMLPLPDAKAKFDGFTGECSINDKNRVEMSLTLPFVAKKTPESLAHDVTLPYFIAVLSPDEEILQRQSFTTKITFDKLGAGASVEDHMIYIPVPSKAEAYKYKVVFGFSRPREAIPAPAPQENRVKIKKRKGHKKS